MKQTLTTEQLKSKMIEKIAVASGLRARDGRQVVAEAIYAEVVEPLLANREAQPVGFTSNSFMCELKNSGVVHAWLRRDEDDPGFNVKLFTAPPAPAVPDIGALTDLIVDRLIDCSAADDDSIADAETFVYNACRAAMLAQPGGTSD